jgi:hypothetical protein
MTRRNPRDRRRYRRAVINELRRIAQETPGQMDGWHHRHLTDEQVERIGDQLDMPTQPNRSMIPEHD